MSGVVALYVLLAVIAFYGLGALTSAAVRAVQRNRNRRQSEQIRLEAAFNRALDARRNGSGIQGRPYSVYNETFPD